MAIIEQEQQSAREQAAQVIAAQAHKRLAFYRLTQIQQAGQESLLPLPINDARGNKYTVDERVGFVAWLMAHYHVDEEMTRKRRRADEEEELAPRQLTRQEAALVREQEAARQERDRGAKRERIFGSGPFQDSRPNLDI